MMKMKKILKVEGMHCEHCAKKVTDALQKITGVSKVKVNLAKKEVNVQMTQDIADDILKQAIKDIDFEVTEII